MSTPYIRADPDGWFRRLLDDIEEEGATVIRSECVTATPKHDACNGDAWDTEADGPAECTCACHDKEKA